MPTKWIHLVQKDNHQEVWRHLPRVKNLLKHWLSPITSSFWSSHTLPSPAINKNRYRLCSISSVEWNFPNARSFSVYWLIATASLISIQNHRQISSCIDFFSNKKYLVTYENHFSSLGILSKVSNSSLLYLGTNKNIELFIIKKVKDASVHC